MSLGNRNTYIQATVYLLSKNKKVPRRLHTDCSNLVSNSTQVFKMLRTKVHIVISAIGMFFGISAFICFCIVYANIEAGMWALLSGIHASLTFMLHCHYLKETLHVNFSRKALQYLGDFGMVGFVSGLALTLFYLFLEIYYQADIIPIKTSIIIKLVWSFMMMKWGFILYIFTKKYLRTYNDHQLFSENPNVEET